MQQHDSSMWKSANWFASRKEINIKRLSVLSHSCSWKPQGRTRIKFPNSGPESTVVHDGFWNLLQPLSKIRSHIFPPIWHPPRSGGVIAVTGGGMLHQKRHRARQPATSSYRKILGLKQHQLGHFSLRKDEIKRLVLKLAENSRHDFAKVEMKSKFAELSFNIIMRMVAGKRYFGEDEDYDEAKRFRGLVKEVVEFGGVSYPGDFLPVLRWIDYRNFEKNLAKLFGKMDAFLEELVDEHRRNKNDNTVIDHLLSLQESQPEYYTDQIIKGIIMVSFLPSVTFVKGSQDYFSELQPKRKKF
ncbi:hypothetical protein ACH5RR_011490 [Cinchona calisaya]|uniref:Cytochrome P450 n=1 Tax=Cinchona calisaya TaxID=153742 RepID=A0ABD3A6H1_9GENT